MQIQEQDHGFEEIAAIGPTITTGPISNPLSDGNNQFAPDPESGGYSFAPKTDLGPPVYDTPPVMEDFPVVVNKKESDGNPIVVAFESIPFVAPVIDWFTPPITDAPTSYSTDWKNNEPSGGIGNPFVPDPEIYPKSLPLSSIAEIQNFLTPTTGPINNPIINTPQTVVSTTGQTNAPIAPTTVESLLNLLDRVTGSNIPRGTPSGSGMMVIPGSQPATNYGNSGANNITFYLVIIGVIGLVITFIVNREKIVSEVKSVV